MKKKVIRLGCNEVDGIGFNNNWDAKKLADKALEISIHLTSIEEHLDLLTNKWRKLKEEE